MVGSVLSLRARCSRILTESQARERKEWQGDQLEKHGERRAHRSKSHRDIPSGRCREVPIGGHESGGILLVLLGLFAYI